MEGIAAQTEKEREPLAAAIKAALVRVTHTLKVELVKQSEQPLTPG
jgi:hypothetical protein